MGTAPERGAVVVGVDGTPSTGLALDWASDEAALRRLPLHVVLAADVPGLAGGSVELTSLWDSWGPAARAAYVPALEDARDAAVRRHPDLAVLAELVNGSPADALRARAPRSTMVVIGSRHRGIVRDLLGRRGVGGPLAAGSPCPVVVVREPEPVTPAPSQVVVGVDGSDTSLEAVGFAFEEAAFREARLIAVSAWQPPRRRAGSSAQPADPRDAAIRMLAESVAGWQERYPQVDVVHQVVRGQPVHVLAGAAERSLSLVVGSRGLGGLSGLLLGSVSRALMHRAPCPLVIVPHHAMTTAV